MSGGRGSTSVDRSALQGRREQIGPNLSFLISESPADVFTFETEIAGGNNEREEGGLLIESQSRGCLRVKCRADSNAPRQPTRKILALLVSITDYRTRTIVTTMDYTLSARPYTRNQITCKIKKRTQKGRRGKRQVTGPLSRISFGRLSTQYIRGKT